MAGTAIAGQQVLSCNVLRPLISCFIPSSQIVAFILVYSREKQKGYALKSYATRLGSD